MNKTPTAMAVMASVCYIRTTKNQSLFVQFSDSDHKVSASSTQIVHLGKPEADSNVKLQLIDIISELPLTKLTYSKALKSIKWNTIEITGYTTDKLKEELNEIIKATVTVRSLGEILTDYRDNRAKYEFKNHPNRPTKPVNAHMLYIKDNKEKLQQKYEKAHPDEKTSYVSFANLTNSRIFSLISVILARVSSLLLRQV